jgi:hypothetical protein
MQMKLHRFFKKNYPDNNEPEINPMKAAEKKIEIACQQVLTDDGSVFSIQWTVIPQRHAVTLTPNFLLDRYQAYLRRVTLSLVRPLQAGEGLAFRLLTTKVTLLTFAAPAYSSDKGIHAVTLQICEGHFVQASCCNRGQFSFITESVNGGVKITVQLSEYYPRLLGSRTPSLPRKWLYQLTQAWVHKIVTVRFLARLYRELEGKGTSFRVVKVCVQEGEEI